MKQNLEKINRFESQLSVSWRSVLQVGFVRRAVTFWKLENLLS